MNNYFIILAAGSGNRFNTKKPKQYFLYKNKQLFEHSLIKSIESKLFKKIVLVVDNPKNIQKKYSDKVLVIKGGKKRSDSSLIALKAIKKLKPNNVLIHDAARPNFSIKLTLKLINELKKNTCVIPVISCSDTVVFKTKYVDRNKIKFLQTPQAFKLNDLYNLHKKNKNKNITDDSTLFSQNNKKIKFIAGENENKKITFNNDLNYKEKYYGIGYDIHQMAKGYDLYVGGIKIPSEFGSVGHSDGDSLLHALIDSFLGAAKLGDIGTHFPNTKKYKGIRSTKLLKEVMKKLKAINLKISSIDLNIILQSPNLKNYKENIRLNISKLCKINKENINVKAKTADKIGIIGQKKALACEVISTLENVR